MIRRAFRMWVADGKAGEYEERHNPIWPELERTLLEHGVYSYSIFLDDQSNELFAVVEFESAERWEAVAKTDVCKRWWRHMREIMPSNPDDSPVARECREVFHLRRSTGIERPL
jgi:L-rhamnose mutarotase